MCGIGHNGHVEEEGALKELPHVVRGVDLLHLHLRVDVAVGQEVDVGVLHLGDGVLVADQLFILLKSLYLYFVYYSTVYSKNKPVVFSIYKIKKMAKTLHPI